MNILKKRGIFLAILIGFFICANIVSAYDVSWTGTSSGNLQCARNRGARCTYAGYGVPGGSISTRSCSDILIYGVANCGPKIGYSIGLWTGLSDASSKCSARGDPCLDGWDNGGNHLGCYRSSVYGYAFCSCTSQDYSSCYNDDVYWYNSCGDREGIKEECGNDYWSSSNYCYNEDVYRDKVDRGCSGSSCYSNTIRIKQEECGSPGCDESTETCNTCSDECSASGETKCEGGIAYICGYYDTDPCLDWNGGNLCDEGCTIEGIGGKCAKPVCSDSDGGLDYEIKGTTIFDSSVNYVEEEDSCLDGNTLREWYCEGENSEPVSVDVKCYDVSGTSSGCNIGDGFCDECIPLIVECGNNGCGDITECSDPNEVCRDNNCVPVNADELYFWTDLNSEEISGSSVGSTVIAVAETSISQDSEIVFEIREDDRVFGVGQTEFIKNVTTTTDLNGIAKYTWNMDSEEFLEIDEGNTYYEVYFVAHVDGRMEESSTLNVEKQDLCVSTYGESDEVISYCADYTQLKDDSDYGLEIAQEQCNLDCNDAHLEDREFLSSGDKMNLVDDGCEWNGEIDACRYWFSTDSGNGGDGCLTRCQYLTTNEGACNPETGLREIEQVATFIAEDCNEYTFEEFNETFPDRHWECDALTDSIRCAQSVQLPIFGWMGLLVSSLIILTIYVLKSKN
mgnify:CR=1 FL=1